MDPLARFSEWYERARSLEGPEPTSVVLATSTKAGAPSARVVLLKGHDDRGFVVYTNLESRKARELDENPHAALLFYWPELLRQVRVEGAVTRASDEEADAYFATRGRESQLGAWASAQSRPLKERAELEARFAEAAARFPGEVPRPPGWGGLRVAADRIEFWESRPHRLHQRELFTRADEGWRLQLLNP